MVLEYKSNIYKYKLEAIAIDCKQLLFVFKDSAACATPSLRMAQRAHGSPLRCQLIASFLSIVYSTSKIPVI